MEFNNIVGKCYPQRAKGVKADKIPWNDSNYIWEEKYDGDRRLIHIGREEIKITSRSKSKKTNLPVEKSENLPHIIKDLELLNLEGTIIDGESIHKNGFEYVRKILGSLPERAIKLQEEFGKIEFIAYDILFYKGECLIDKPLYERKKYLEKLLTEINSNYINLVRTINLNSEEKLKDEFANIINNGGEGLVAKRKDSNYRLSTEKCLSPLKNAWIKVKKDFNGDFVIMGFDEPTKEYKGEHLDSHQYWEKDGRLVPPYDIPKGSIPVTKFYYNNWIGAIRFGEYENGVLVERGSCTGMTEEMRIEFTNNKEIYIGAVIEIDAMERTKDKALRQPVFKRIRNDKLPEECTYETQQG